MLYQSMNFLARLKK